MKKIGIVMVAVLMLTGCGSAISEIDIDKTSKIIEKELNSMGAIDDSTLSSIYGFELDKMDEYIIKQNADGDLYAIIKTKDKSTIKTNMDNYFKKVKEFNTAYSPERLEILENRLEKEIGDYLIYIVAKESDKIYEKILDDME